MEEENRNKKSTASRRERRDKKDHTGNRDLLDKARDSLENLPELREAKINMVRKRILSGYYDSPEARELLVTKLIHYLKKRLR